jgi:hypothetical protein
LADEQKQPWYKSLPGLLTAATGFVAALSGLVAGLNQLGVFKREPPAQQVVGSLPGRDTASAHAAAPVMGGSASSAEPGPASSVTPPAAQRAATPPAGTGRRPAPAPATRPASPDTAAAPSPTSRPAAIGTVLPKGTTLELTVSSRTCAPADGQKRFTARLETPIKVQGATVLPSGSTAVLHVRRAGTPPEPQVRLDSLMTQGGELAVTSAQARVRREAVNGACIRANGRIVVTLGADVRVLSQ